MKNTLQKMDKKTNQIHQLRQLIEQKQYKEAINLAYDMRQYDNDLDYIMEMGQLLKATSDYAGAIKWFEKVLKIDKKNIYAVRGMAECLINTNYYYDAIKFINFLEYKKKLEIIKQIGTICVNNNDIVNLDKIFKILEQYSRLFKIKIVSFIILEISNKIFQANDKNINNIFINIVKKHLTLLSKKNKIIITEKIGIYCKNHENLKSAENWFKEVLKVDKSNKHAFRGIIECLTNAGHYMETVEYIDSLNKKERFNLINDIFEKYIKSENIDSLRYIVKHNNILKNDDTMSIIVITVRNKIEKYKKSSYIEKGLIELLKYYLPFVNTNIHDQIVECIAYYYACQNDTVNTLNWIFKIRYIDKVKYKIIKTIRNIGISQIPLKNILSKLEFFCKVINDKQSKNLIHMEIKKLKKIYVKQSVKKLIEQKKYKQALQIIQHSHAYKSARDIEYFLDMGQLLKATSNFKEAIKYLKKTINVDKNNIFAINGIIDCLNNIGQYEEILQYIDRLNKHERIQIIGKIAVNSVKTNNIKLFEKALMHIQIYFRRNSKIVSSILLQIADNIYKHIDISTKQKLINVLNHHDDFLPNMLKCVYYVHMTNNTVEQRVELISKLLNDIYVFPNKIRTIIKYLNILYRNINGKKIKNILLSEIEILQKKSKVKSRPIRMHVVLTTKCNLKCVMCDVCKHDYTISDKNIKIVEKHLPYLKYVSWQGGEVFLYHRFYHLVKLAHKYNVQQEFVTNGLLLNDKLISMIAEYNITLSISIDSVQASVYEYVRKGAKFENLIAKLNKLQEYKVKNRKIRYSMAVVVMSLNYKELDELCSFALYYGFDAIYFQRYIPVHNYNDVLQLNREQIKYVTSKIQKLKQMNKIIITTNISDTLEYKQMLPNKIEENRKQNNNSNISDIDNKNVKKIIQIKERLSCIAPWKTLFLDFGLKIKFSAYCSSFKITKNINNIWNSSQIIKYRKSIINGNLYECCNNICKNAEDDGKEIRKYGWK